MVWDQDTWRTTFTTMFHPVHCLLLGCISDCPISQRDPAGRHLEQSLLSTRSPSVEFPPLQDLPGSVTATVSEVDKGGDVSAGLYAISDYCHAGVGVSGTSALAA